jgi:hypothetical protein
MFLQAHPRHERDALAEPAGVRLALAVAEGRAGRVGEWGQ